MTLSRLCRRCFSQSRFVTKALAIALAFMMVLPSHSIELSAQGIPLDCGINGLCTSSSISNLLGLPQGTLKILSYSRADSVLQSPAANVPLRDETQQAVSAWGPLEFDTRVGLSDIHGVPNDFRLPHFADSDLRAGIFMRLLTLAKRKSRGETLTAAEQDALSAFSNLIVARRKFAAQKALDEYARWSADPCHYRTPVDNQGNSFGFAQYDPGPQCNVGGVHLAGPPRPPTADQFKAYGAAVAMQGFSNADSDAALRNTDEALAIGVAVASAALVGGIATIAATASTAVAFTFAAMAGSFSVLGTIPSATAIGSAVSAGAVGVGVAAALPALVIVSVVVAVVYIIQFIEDQSVLPTLQDAYNSALQPPDIVSMVGDTLTFAELLTTALIPMTPTLASERIAAGPTPPTGRLPGDPKFEVDGVQQDIIETFTPDSKLQQTFMSQGWFVTRTRTATSPEQWTPWKWSLTFSYTGGLSNFNPTPLVVGIQPSGFLNINNNTTPPTVTKTNQFFPLSVQTLQSHVVKWAGNHRPTLNVTVSEKPEIGTPVTFKAGATDADAGDTITIRWYVEDPLFAALQPNFEYCSFTPPPVVNDPVSGFPYGCPWRRIDDSGAGITYTYGRPGTFGAMVLVKDSQGAVSSQQFPVTIANLAPALTITQLAASQTTEGQPISISGTVNYPGLPDGRWGTLTKIHVEWGDGQITTRIYPCNFFELTDGPSDRHCLLGGPLGAVPAYIQDPPNGPPLPPGPWTFTFSHTYAYSAAQPLAAPTSIKVYATTDLGGVSQTELMNVSITNLPPVLETAPVCPLFGAFGTLCIGGDIREVAVGQPLTIHGRIVDTPGAKQIVRAKWNDGSSVYPAGCTDDGCPGFASPWPGATPPLGNVTAQYLSVSHTFGTTGNYSITLEADDGGPGGRTTYTTHATIFGVSELAGPATVNAGAPTTYTYTLKSPDGAPTPTLTPACEGGTVSGAVPGSFTCAFPDVVSATPEHVRLQALVGNVTFNRSLDVAIQPRPVSFSTNPTWSDTAIAGTAAQFKYAITASPFVMVHYQPTCGAFGSVTARTDGSSFTCKFDDVNEQRQSTVQLVATDANSSATFSLAVTLNPDNQPPVLTLPDNISVNSTSNAGATVPFSTSAQDAVSGAAAVSCTPQSGSQFPIGTTTVNCSAKDWKDNQASGHFDVVVNDVTPPSLTLPASQTLDATSPGGVTATFAAGAVDAVPATPPVSCQPPSGSMFAIGTTAVSCTASDKAGNKGSGQFNIKVRGAAEQLAILQDYVDGINTGPGKAISAELKNAVTALNADRNSECTHLDNIIGQATKPGANSLTPEQSGRIVSDVTRIKAVVGCTR